MASDSDSDSDDILNAPFPPSSEEFGPEGWIPAPPEPAPTSSAPPAVLSVLMLFLTGMGVLVACVGVGAGMYLGLTPDAYLGNKTKSGADGVYISVVTLTTAGYGDLVPKTQTAKILMALYILVGVGLMNAVISIIVYCNLGRLEDRIVAYVSGGLLTDISRLFFKLILTLILDVIFIMSKMVALIAWERATWGDAFYTTVVSATGVGFGDIYFKKTGGRVFDFIWLLVCRHTTDRVFNLLGEMWTSRRSSNLFISQIRQQLTLRERVVLDADGTGEIRTSEWIIHILETSGRLGKKELTELRNQVDRVDPQGTGKFSMTSI